MRAFVLAVALASLCTPALAARMLFWNLTTVTISSLTLARAGTQQWGPNQCENDPDGAVDPDERLQLTDVAPGAYDVQLTDKSGRTCTVRNVKVQTDRPYAFSLGDRDLTECRR